jgi:hypothetical protein
MSYTNESGRLQILEDSGEAAREVDMAILALGEAYEHLDDDTADELETAVFKPLQGAFGLLKRTRSEFAERFALPLSEPESAHEMAPAQPRELLEQAADALQAADDTIAELQDTLLPVEVGDQELRAGLSAVRTLIAPLPGVCDELIRTLGR